MRSVFASSSEAAASREALVIGLPLETGPTQTQRKRGQDNPCHYHPTSLPIKRPPPKRQARTARPSSFDVVPRPARSVRTAQRHHRPTTTSQRENEKAAAARRPRFTARARFSWGVGAWYFVGDCGSDGRRRESSRVESRMEPRDVLHPRAPFPSQLPVCIRARPCCSRHLRTKGTRASSI